MRKWYPGILIAAATIFSIAVYSRLPDTLPTHWSIDGTPEQYAPRWLGAFVMPAFALVLWLVLRVIPSIDPRRANIAKFRPSYDLVVLVGVAAASLVHVGILGAALGWHVPMPTVAALLMGVLFVALGNVLPRSRSNFMFGVRTPWTLSNDRVWARSNRLGGYLLVAAGLICIAASLLPSRWAFIVSIGVLAVAAIVSVVASYVFWTQEQRG